MVILSTMFVGCANVGEAPGNKGALIPPESPAEGLLTCSDPGERGVFTGKACFKRRWWHSDDLKGHIEDVRDPGLLLCRKGRTRDSEGELRPDVSEACQPR